MTTKKLEFRPYSLYATKEVMQKKLNEGFEEIAFSYEGEWPKIRNDRIARMCVFFSPDRRIETYEHHEIDDVTVIRALTPFGVDFKGEDGLKERLEQGHIRLGKRRGIVDVLQDIIGWEYR